MTKGSLAIVRLQLELSGANERLLLAVQRPSSLNAIGVIVDSRSPTTGGRTTDGSFAAVILDANAALITACSGTVAAQRIEVE